MANVSNTQLYIVVDGEELVGRLSECGAFVICESRWGEIPYSLEDYEYYFISNDDLPEVLTESVLVMVGGQVLEGHLSVDYDSVVVPEVRWVDGTLVNIQKVYPITESLEWQYVGAYCTDREIRPYPHPVVVSIGNSVYEGLFYETAPSGSNRVTDAYAFIRDEDNLLHSLYLPVGDTSLDRLGWAFIGDCCLLKPRWYIDGI